MRVVYDLCRLAAPGLTLLAWLVLATTGCQMPHLQQTGGETPAPEPQETPDPRPPTSGAAVEAVRRLGQHLARRSESGHHGEAAGVDDGAARA